MSYLRIIHGRVIDPSQGIDRIDDLWIEGDKILGVGPRPNLLAPKTSGTNGAFQRGLQHDELGCH